MIGDFEELYQSLHLESDPWMAIHSIQSYVSRALAWAFADRLQPTGSFQHTFTPDFYIHLQPGPKLAVHMRFSTVSARALISALVDNRRDDYKHLMLVRGSIDDSVAGSTLTMLRKRNILVTSFDLIDQIMRVVKPLEELGPSRVGLKVRVLRNRLETWCLESNGWHPAPRLEEFARSTTIDIVHQSRAESETSRPITFWTTRTDVGEKVSSYLRDSTLAGSRRITDRSSSEVTRGHGYELLQPILDVASPSVMITTNEARAHQPLIACTFSRHAPMGQNPYQVVPVAVACAENRVPFFLVAPERLAVTREDGSTTVEKIHPILLQAFLRMMDIHKVPVLFLPWPLREQAGGPVFWDDPRFLQMPDRSSGVVQLLFECVNAALEDRFLQDTPLRLLGFAGVARRRLEMEEARFREGTRLIESPPESSGVIMPTTQLRDYFGETRSIPYPSRLQRALDGRPSVLVFKTRSRTVRADPYLGTLLAYDYAFCRLGPLPQDRATSVVAHFREVYLEEAIATLWVDEGLRHSRSTKPAQYLTYCDALVCKDGYLMRQDGEWRAVH